MKEDASRVYVMKRVLLLAYFFVLMNWAAVMALYYFLQGREDIWRPQQTGIPDSERQRLSGPPAVDHRSAR